MVLAARCPECNTAFRIVPDQLKISEGWVRCGHCSYVFNAQENQFEISEAALEQTLQEQKKQGQSTFASSAFESSTFRMPTRQDSDLSYAEKAEKEANDFFDAALKENHQAAQKINERTEKDKQQNSFPTPAQKTDEHTVQEFIVLSEDSKLENNDHTNYLETIEVSSSDDDTAEISLEEIPIFPDTILPDEFNFEDTHLSEFHVGWQDSITAKPQEPPAEIKLPESTRFGDSTIVAEEVVPGHSAWDPGLSDSDAFESAWEDRDENKLSASQSDSEDLIELSLDENLDGMTATELSEYFAATRFNTPDTQEIVLPAFLSIDPLEEELEVDTAIGFMPTAFEKLNAKDKQSRIALNDTSKTSLSPFSETQVAPPSQEKQDDHEIGLSLVDDYPPQAKSRSVEELKKAGAVVIAARSKRDFASDKSPQTHSSSAFLSSITLEDQETNPSSTFQGSQFGTFTASKLQQTTSVQSADSISALPFEHSYFQLTNTEVPSQKTALPSHVKHTANFQDSLSTTEQEEKDFVTTVLDAGYSVASTDRTPRKKRRSTRAEESLYPSHYQADNGRSSVSKIRSEDSLLESKQSSLMANDETDFPDVSFAKPDKLSAMAHNPILKLGQRVACLALIALLFIQLGAVLKEPLAENIPSLRPMLTTLCKPFGCTIDYPRNIKGFTIYDSFFRRANHTDPEVYTLMLLLKNKDHQSLASPWVELTLIDNATGQTYSQKTFSLQDLGIDMPYVQANQEVHITSNLKIKTPENMTLGFKVILFYP